MEASDRVRSLDATSAILLVEDNEDEVFMMKRAFRKAEIQNPLLVAADGEEALEYLEGRGKFASRESYPFPVAVFLDLNMPKKGGLEVLESIRASSTLRRLNVNILSSSTRPADIDQAAFLGANAYFIKPTQFATLEAMVRTWYARSQFEAFAA